MALPPKTSLPIAAALATAALLLAGCGSGSTHQATAPATSGGTVPATPGSTGTGTGTSTSTGSSRSTTGATGVDYLPQAETPQYGDFPKTQGRTLQQLADLAKSEVSLGPATSEFVQGVERFSFALTTKAGGFVYAPTAIYIGSGAGGQARGPYLAPADPMTVEPQYRSKQNTGPGGIKAIYGSELPLPKPGTYGVLALTQTPSGLIGSDTQIAVAPSSQIPNVGQRPRDSATDTPATLHGDEAELTTRIPPEKMASVSLDK